MRVLYVGNDRLVRPCLRRLRPGTGPGILFTHPLGQVREALDGLAAIECHRLPIEVGEPMGKPHLKTCRDRVLFLRDVRWHRAWHIRRTPAQPANVVRDPAPPLNRLHRLADQYIVARSYDEFDLHTRASTRLHLHTNLPT